MLDDSVSEVVRRFSDDNEKVLPAREYCDYVVNNEGDFNSTINRILDIMREN
jgi:guanylate kinase